MITQTYDDWQRMLAACWVASFGTADVMPATTEWLDLEHARNWRSAAVARALGIDKRRRLEWRAAQKESVLHEWWVKEGRQVKATITCNSGVWAAAWTFGAVVQVVGHPTRESAIHHLECLLGRELGREAVPVGAGTPAWRDGEAGETWPARMVRS